MSAAEMRLVADGLGFPEGPVVLPDGSVLVTEVRTGTLAIIEPGVGVVRRIEVGGGPNGAALGPDGRLYVCNNGGLIWNESNGIVSPGRAVGRGENQPPDYTGGSIQVVDLANGRVEDLYLDYEGHRLSGPNDLVFDAHGGFYFTDSGKRRTRDLDFGGLYYAAPDGSSIAEIVYPLLGANGVVLSPDGERIYVAESPTARVWAWTLSGPGVIAHGSGPGFLGGDLLHVFTELRVPDSMAVQRDGAICLATVLAGEITVIAPGGGVIRTVPVPDDPIPTNIAFGGDDLETAYITAAGTGRLWTTRWDEPGTPLNFG